MTRNNDYRAIVSDGIGRAKVCEMLAIYFAVNPDEELTCKDAMTKFGISSPSSVWVACRALEKRGIVAARRSPRKYSATPVVYTAGPTLLKIIGRVATNV